MPKRPGEYSTDLFADAAIDFIQRKSHAKQPWFCYLPFNAPHFPNAKNKRPGQPVRWQAPDRFLAVYGLSPDESDPQQRYYAVVTALDEAIGSVLDALDTAGATENTFVFFYSDNGAFRLGRDGLDVGSNFPLRHGGVTCWEGGLRVAALARWPGRIKPGSVSEEPVNGTDWLPTLCAVASIAPPKPRPLDGANVLPALLHGKPVTRERPMMWWLWHARGGYEVAMRDGDYKILATMLPQADPGTIADARQPQEWTIMQFIKEANLGRFEMFNVTEDPSETTNLVSAQPERFNSLKRRMIDLHAEIRAEGPDYQLGKTKKK